MRKIQNTAEFEKLAINKTALLTKVVVGSKKLDVSVKKL